MNAFMYYLNVRTHSFSERMYTKNKTQLCLDPELDRDMRILAATHRATISSVAEAMIRHCLKSPHFLAKLEKDPEF